ncbi:FAD binding protein [Opitutaceae bacterium TAV1]|nr:FAD binding protein [Opitutaceae bacterium TAV1]
MTTATNTTVSENLMQKPDSLPLPETTWDVIVVGGGPAGCTAAAAAAREGARTLLIEQTQALGGCSTTGLVPIWAPLTDQKEIIYRGLAEKIINGSRIGMDHVQPLYFGWTPINFEHVKRVYDDLVIGYGAEIRFHTFLAAVDAPDNTSVSSILVAGKSGLRRLKARVYVDCTGDGDLAAWAGADFLKGGAGGELQPGSHCFIFSNVNETAYKRFLAERGDRALVLLIKEIIASGKYPEIEDTHCLQIKIGPGTYGFNAGHVEIDNTDPASLSRAAIRGRRIAEAFRRALAEFQPEIYGDAFLVSTGTQVGVRETRRIVGDYLLTVDDWLERRTFPDEIARNSYFIDVHSSLEAIRARPKDAKPVNKFPHYGPGESHGIPYRCLTPKGLRNVLVAGRCVSADRPVQGSIRVMPVCLVMGEAAGMAAAHAAQNHASDVHEVDTGFLRQRLRAEGAYLP